MSLSTLYPSTRPSLLLDFAGSETIDPRITFARASTARFYDQNTVAKAEENLLAQSQVFQAWALNALTVTADTTTAPDGTSTADALVETSATGGHGAFQTLTFAAVPYTFSVFLKANTRTWAYLRLSVGAWFNLSTGTVGTVQGGVTAAITSVGNGWYRCSITRTPSAGQNFPTVFVATADGVDSYAGDGTSSIFAWGAQLEERSAVTAYTATTTAPITRYQPQLMTAAANIARLDHDPITREARGLLIEESRSNLAQFSEDLSNAYWTKTRSSITTNAAVAPDGTLTADRLVEDTTASNTHQAIANTLSAVTSGTTYTFSAYVKASGRTHVQAVLAGTPFFINPDNTTATFALTGAGSVVGTTGGATATITAIGNDWYRCTITRAAVATDNAAGGFILSNGTTTSYTGDGYSGIFVWGAQLEAGAFATSYIARLDATAASRAVDLAVMTGANVSSWFSNREGTFVGEATPTFASATDGTVRFVAATYDTISYGNALRMERTAGLFRHVQTVAGTSTVTTAAWSTGTTAKFASAFAASDSAASFAGGAAAAVAGAVPPGMATLSIGSAGLTDANVWAGHIRKIAFYPRRLTNAQLQALTR